MITTTNSSRNRGKKIGATTAQDRRTASQNRAPPHVCAVPPRVKTLEGGNWEYGANLRQAFLERNYGADRPAGKIIRQPKIPDRSP